MKRLLVGIVMAVFALPALSQPPHRGQPARGPEPVRPPPLAHNDHFPVLGRLPRPNHWTGDTHGLTPERWRSGHWVHARHDHMLAWWCVVGLDWYFFSQPILPYPDQYAPPGHPFGWWYWCEALQDYYPYVTYCPSDWRQLPAL
jgi:hypothetical protein